MKRGLILSSDAAFDGYTLFAPLNSTTTYLVDMCGEKVHSWPSKFTPGQAVYLLEDGSLLRAARQPRNRHFEGGGVGGRIERLAPDGKVLWRYVCADENRCQHHDIKPLPNGNILLIAWEKKTREEVLAAGRNPKEMASNELWPDCVLEVEPRGRSRGKIVWEWHVWDHLIQDADPAKPNHGVVAEHPELVDLNYSPSLPRETPEEVQRLRSLGYVGGGDDESAGEEAAEEEKGPPLLPLLLGAPDMRADWCHTNAVDYNPTLDQIALSVHSFNEVWIIDHSTSTAEAAGHSGGRSGKGGDLLYRWGNPRTYGAGGGQDQMLFAQHDVRWIPPGSPGAGNLMVFNNGPGRPDGQYSSVVEITPPIDASGRYKLERGKAFGPSKPTWEYTAPKREDFFASHISGAERLPNGNTLICSGEEGRIFEVDRAGKILWDYANPYIEHDGPAGGAPPPMQGFARPQAGGRLPPMPPGGFGPPPRGGPGGPPRGPGGPGGPPGGDPGGGMFRAARLPSSHPGIHRLLSEAASRPVSDE